MKKKSDGGSDWMMNEDVALHRLSRYNLTMTRYRYVRGTSGTRTQVLSYYTPAGCTCIGPIAFRLSHPHPKMMVIPVSNKSFVTYYLANKVWLDWKNLASFQVLSFLLLMSLNITS